MRFTRLLAALLALLLAGCARSPAPPPDPTASLRVRVQAARGLPFRRRVDLELLDPANLADHLRAELDRVVPPSEIVAQQTLLEAFGLLPPGTDLRRALLDFQADGVVGYFSPVDGALYVVDGAHRTSESGRSMIETVAVHELAHALQDMHFVLPRVLLGVTDHDDLVFALSALLEGDATWVVYRDEVATSAEAIGGASLPQHTARENEQEVALHLKEAEALGVPRVLRESFLLVYSLGYQLVEWLVETGGPRSLDAAMLDPPLSSEELLHPESYLHGRRPIAWLELDAQAVRIADCRIGGANTWGELGVRTWALEHGVDPLRARSAAAGWDGDRALLLACADGPRAAWLVQFDTAADARELSGLAGGLDRAPDPALAPWHVAQDGTRVLISSGFDADESQRLLRDTPERRFATLDAYLEARPQVMERAETLRHAGAR